MSGPQVELDWAGTDLGQGAAGAPAASAPSGGAADASHLTDEEILGIESPSANGGVGGVGNGGAARIPAQRDNASSDTAVGRWADGNPQTEVSATGAMPPWMAAAAADPQHGGEAATLWREHQEFRAAFPSPVEARAFVQEARAVAEEARAMKELLPGRVRDVVALREATQSVERIDAALFSGDARAQSEVVAELARANPAAFRAMFAEAAKVLAGMGVPVGNGVGASNGSAVRDGVSGLSDANAAIDTNHSSQEFRARASQEFGETQAARFDPAAYAAFERATNDAVGRDVRGSIGETLARVLPDGVAEGAARRMSEDIFNEVHRALAGDRALSEQVAGILRDAGQGGLPDRRLPRRARR